MTRKELLDKPGLLEQHLVPSVEWYTCGAPKEALELAKEESMCAPTGIAKHPEHGWFVIQSTGQGPYIIWQEEASDAE